MVLIKERKWSSSEREITRARERPSVEREKIDPLQQFDFLCACAFAFFFWGAGGAVEVALRIIFTVAKKKRKKKKACRR